MDVRAVVGLNIQRLRRERNVSQEELALRSGCTRGYLSGIEAGRRNPSIVKLSALARELEVDIFEFFIKPASRSRSGKLAGSSVPVDRPAGIAGKNGHRRKR